MDYVLKTNNLSKRYHNFHALNGLSMSVPKGAIYGFVGKNGACREVMAMELLKSLFPTQSVEILARGLVVLFPEPLNQKAEAVMISNGIHAGEYMSVQLESSDFGENTLILTFEEEMKNRILEMENAQNVYVLTEVTGDELEILDPYGAELVQYGICFETMEKTVSKLAAMLNEGIYFTE